ncbi:MAG: M3 family oligoendopeptidase [Dissulfuribacterales bacterium]
MSQNKAAVKKGESFTMDLGVASVRWDITHLYQGISDDRIAQDMAACETEAKAIARRFAGRLAVLAAEEFFELLSRMERLLEMVGRVSSFASLNFSTQVTNSEAGAFLQKIKEQTSFIVKELVFFDLEWANLSNDEAKKLLESPALGRYRHYLENIRRYRPHLLSHQEERLLLELSPVGVSAWVNLFEKVFAEQRYGERRRPQEEVLADLYSPDRAVRREAARELTDGLKSVSTVITHIFNTVLAEKMIEDRLRSYPHWLRSMNLANELEDEAVNALISAVTSRYDIVQHYYALKRRLLGLEELFDYDRYAPLPFASTTMASWSECREMVIRAFTGFSQQMAEIAQRFFDEKWIDAPVVAGKTSGAFAHPTVPSVHPYVLVNYTGNLRDVETVAHELGHGVHQVLAASQGYFNSNTPLTFAETASVFAELLVFHSLMNRLTDKKERLALACSKLESIFATVFRQVAMNRFEDAIHNARRTQGELSFDDFDNIWLKTQKEMFQGSVTLTDDYARWWAYIGHFVHKPGYVYAYAFGELLVLSLYSLFKNGMQGFVERYLELLSAGGSKTPEELMKPFGVNINSREFWMSGLQLIEEMVRDVEAEAESL